MSVKTANILIVDDTEINREIYRNALEGLADVRVFCASSGQQALELARKHECAVYLLDIVMPTMDGFELASLLRQEPGADTTPILFVTAHEPEADFVMRGYRMGAVDYLVQVPIDVEILTQKVRVFLRMYRKRQELADTLLEAQQEIQDLHLRLEEYIQQHEHLRKQATHDTLTGLPNRALFQDRMESAVKRAQRNRQRFALAYVDLNGFKAVNDRHGHATGDSLIRAVAKRMNEAVRATDTVARLGGDEFAILLEGLESVAGAEHAAQKIYRALIEPLTLMSETEHKNVEIVPGASIGLLMFPDHSGERDELIGLADMAMYAAKRAGGGIRIHGDNTAAISSQGEGSHLKVIRSRSEAVGGT